MSAKTSALSSLFMAAALAILAPGQHAAAQTPLTSRFTYQGELTDGGIPVIVEVQMRFRLYDAATIPPGVLVGTYPMDGSSVPVTPTDGRFTVTVDFGVGAFNGDRRWLEIEVDLTPLSPLQEITAVPYALQTRGLFVDDALNVGIGTRSPASTLHVESADARIILQDDDDPASWAQFDDATAAQLKISKFVSAGAALVDLNPAPSDGLSTARVRLFRETNTLGQKILQLFAGDGTTAVDAQIGVDGVNSFFQANGGNVGIGTTSPSQRLEINGNLKVTNGWIGTDLLEPVEIYADGQRALRIEPAYDDDPFTGFSPNIIGGHRENSVDASVFAATIAGGGAFNKGGFLVGHRVTGDFGTVAGGQANTAGQFAAVGGGSFNTADGLFSTVPGGFGNQAHGEGSFAAGGFAVANDDNTFVWSGATDFISFQSTGPNQFLIRAQGGVGIGTNSPREHDPFDPGSEGPVQLHVAKEINKPGFAGNHVALIENTSTGTSADVLALMVGSLSPGGAQNFISFRNGNDESLGSIQGNGAGGIEMGGPGSDFAEWLPHLRNDETFEAGDIVGVFGGHISKQTKGADQAMVVSTGPIVAGNQPDDAELDQYEKVGFIGQCLVKVRGPVSPGDFIVASGDNDGTGIAVGPDVIKPEQMEQIVGQAWESSDDEGVKPINTAVGLAWRDPVSRRLAGLVQRQEAEIERLTSKLAWLDGLAERMEARLAALEAPAGHVALANQGDSK